MLDPVAEYAAAGAYLQRVLEDPALPEALRGRMLVKAMRRWADAMEAILPQMDSMPALSRPRMYLGAHKR